MQTIEVAGGALIRAWTDGVSFDDKARRQVEQTARLPFIHHHIAVMPDVHWGLGSTVGSVIPTRGAIVPAAVGVDIGCGMMAVRTDLRASDLPVNLSGVRSAIEGAVPHGRTDRGGRNDRGAWSEIPDRVAGAWRPRLEWGYERIVGAEPGIARSNSIHHLGTLGTGNHFIEVCLDEGDAVWIMLHSGSRGVGNRIGTTFIRRAQKEAGEELERLPNRDLAFLSEGTPIFDDYVVAVSWAQEYARVNRELMMTAVLDALRGSVRPFETKGVAVNCHHNYVARERHFGEDVWVTRKGAVRAREGDLGIIPGSMGTRSFIVEGLGNPESFHTCSHGAGRVMSRREARKRITLDEHARATRGVECRKDEEVLDESPAAYKDIDAVMAAQADLVRIKHVLHQVVCVKG